MVSNEPLSSKLVNVVEAVVVVDVVLVAASVVVAIDVETIEVLVEITAVVLMTLLVVVLEVVRMLLVVVVDIVAAMFSLESTRLSHSTVKSVPPVILTTYKRSVGLEDRNSYCMLIEKVFHSSESPETEAKS